jgi:hypothetical protein
MTGDGMETRICALLGSVAPHWPMGVHLPCLNAALDSRRLYKTQLHVGDANVCLSVRPSVCLSVEALRPLPHLAPPHKIGQPRSPSQLGGVQPEHARHRHGRVAATHVDLAAYETVMAAQSQHTLTSLAASAYTRPPEPLKLTGSPIRHSSYLWLSNRDPRSCSACQIGPPVSYRLHSSTRTSETDSWSYSRRTKWDAWSFLCSCACDPHTSEATHPSGQPDEQTL